MATAVKLFAYSGMIAHHVATYNGQQSFHANFALKQPYLAREAITAGASALASTADLSASPSTKMLRVEVEPDKRIRYEITPKGADARTADADSPLLYGEDHLEFGPGWTISVVEVA